MGFGPVACSRVADVDSKMSATCRVNPTAVKGGYIKRKFILNY